MRNGTAAASVDGGAQAHRRKLPKRQKMLARRSRTAPSLPGGTSSLFPEIRDGRGSIRPSSAPGSSGAGGEPRFARRASRPDLELRREKARRERAECDLARARRDLEVFAYSVAHDLRTPLQAIVGFADLLLEPPRPELDRESNEMLARIAQAGTRMQQVIDRMLAFACPPRAALERRVVDLSKLAHDVADELVRAEPGRRVEWEIEPGVHSACDVDRARDVVANLLGNAWKYTAPVARPRIEFGVAERRGARTLFVRDNGVGFDGAGEGGFLPVARFDLKAALDSTGVGLPTVQRILELHGGSIAARSAPGQGATFYFTLGSPIARQADEETYR
jgi:light-regulated signal transduction histidine kinase (bacteriophytochrome)